MYSIFLFQYILRPRNGHTEALTAFDFMGSWHPSPFRLSKFPAHTLC